MGGYDGDGKGQGCRDWCLGDETWISMMDIYNVISMI